MKKKILILTFMFIIILSTLAFAEEWTTSVSEDKMTDSETWYALSPEISPESKMEFPYHNIKAWIGIGYNGEDEWVYVGFNESPNLLNTTTEDGYDLIEIRIKWDDEDPENIKLTQEWGSKFIHFQNSEDIISQITKANTLLLELNWYEQGNVYFEFPLDGADEAVEEIHKEFDN